MKKLVWGTLFLCLTLMIAGIWLAARTLQPASVPSVPVPQGQAVPEPIWEPVKLPEPERETITATLLRYEQQVLELVLEDGALLTISVPDEMVSASGEVHVGCPVTLTYLGFAAAPQLKQVTIENFSALPPEEAAQHLLRTLSLEQKVGQLFLARYPEENAAEQAAMLSPGGYVLFARDFAGKTTQQVREMTHEIQSASPIPMLLCVDEEGGTVCRVSGQPLLRVERFAAPQVLYRSGGLDALVRDAEEKCELLLSLGLNVNLAPVCDVSEDPEDFIYARSLGVDAAATAQGIQALVAQMVSSGMGAVLKHFPGYGSNADTHTGIAYDLRAYETFVTSDFLPFAAGIAAGAQAVLVSHNVVICMDEERPASLSSEVHRVLREDLGFTGVAITDDLFMDAIGVWYTPEEAAVQAVLVGNDLLISTQFELQYAAVLQAAQEGRIPRSRIDEAVTRVLAWKISLGLIGTK